MKTDVNVKNTTKRIIVLGMSPYRGGMETYIMNLYRIIIRFGYQFDFYLPHDCPKLPYEDEIIQNGGKIYRFAYGKTENVFLHFINIYRVLKASGVVGVYINTCVLVDIDFLIIAKMLKKPVRIIHSHNGGYMSEMSHLNQLLEMRNKKIVSRYSTGLLACSDIAGKWMFGEKSIYKIIHNGIDVEKYKFNAEIRERMRQEYQVENQKVIGVVGRIQYQKNPEFIVEIFEQIHKKNKNTTLIWAGDGETTDVERIQNMLKEKKIEDKVKMLGMVSNTNELYQMFDEFLLPSRFEGLPFVLVEAQCAGVRCWTSTEVSEEANITGDVNYISLSKPASEWAERMLISQKNERDRGVEFIRNSGYSISDTARVIADILNKMI